MMEEFDKKTQFGFGQWLPTTHEALLWNRGRWGGGGGDSVNFALGCTFNQVLAPENDVIPLQVPKMAERFLPDTHREVCFV